jgi:hypothetical protein
MSKKSRKRNKKILAVLGLAAAATAASRRNKGTAQGASGSDKAKFTSDAAYKTPVAPNRIQTKPPTILSTPRKKNYFASPKWNNLDTSEVNTDYVAPSTKQYNKQDFGLGPYAAKDGGRIGLKHGGGAAKRGVSPILLKGKK